MDLSSTHVSYSLMQITDMFRVTTETELSITKILILDVVRPTQLSKHDVHELEVEKIM